jgi:transcriptional regulator with XRE-family HTH domain
MDIRPFVAFKTPACPAFGEVPAIASAFYVAENDPPMLRPSPYRYTVTDPPGINVHRLREALGWSLRQLAEHCRPALDHTTVRRIEQNLGYTQDTLERIASALGRGLGAPVAVSDLFLPRELADWPQLPDAIRRRIAEHVEDSAAAIKYRSAKP